MLEDILVQTVRFEPQNALCVHRLELKLVCVVELHRLVVIVTLRLEERRNRAYIHVHSKHDVFPVLVSGAGLTFGVL